MTFDLTDVRCTQCGEHKPDQVGLSLPATDDAGVQDLGFCCVGCLLAWIDITYPTRAVLPVGPRDLPRCDCEADSVPSVVRALAASPSPGRRSAVDGRGGDAGGAQAQPLGEVELEQAPPTSRPPHGALALDRKSSIAGREGRAVSVPPVRVRPASFAEAEATIQRLIAQADSYSRRVAEMEGLVARSRFVADHWRVSILAGDTTGTMAWGAHGLCMVLAALDGETDPQECGISRTAWDEFEAVSR